MEIQLEFHSLYPMKLSKIKYSCNFKLIETMWNLICCLNCDDRD